MEEPELQPLIKFQYIKCEGSTQSGWEEVVKEEEFQYIKCEGSTGPAELVDVVLTLFQYIKCEGSTR